MNEKRLLPFYQQLKNCKFIADDLRVDKSTRLNMYKSIYELNGINDSFMTNVKLYEKEDHILNFVQLYESTIIDKPTAEIYELYGSYCYEHGISQLNHYSFSKVLCREYGFYSINKRINGTPTRILTKGDIA